MSDSRESKNNLKKIFPVNCREIPGNASQKRKNRGLTRCRERVPACKGHFELWPVGQSINYSGDNPMKFDLVSFLIIALIALVVCSAVVWASNNVDFVKDLIG